MNTTDTHPATQKILNRLEAWENGSGKFKHLTREIYRWENSTATPSSADNVVEEIEAAREAMREAKARISTAVRDYLNGDF